MSIVNSNQLTTVPNPTNLTDAIEAIKALTENQETLRKFGYGRDEASFKVLAEITVNNKILSRLDKGTTAIVTVDNSSSAITIKLPAVSDTFDGDSYFIFDKRGYANTHNITLDLNSNELDGGTTNPIININKGFFQVVCTDQGKFITILDSKKQHDLTGLTGILKSDGTAISGSSTINDLDTQTADYDVNGFTFINLKKIWLEDTDKTTIEDTNKGFLDIRGLGSVAEHYVPISFSSSHYSTNALAKIAMKSTDSGSELHLVVSNNYSVGANLTIGKFDVLGLNLKGGIFFDVNNTYSIGSATYAPANIYSVNALTVTSDNNFKEDIEKNIPLGLDFVKKVAQNAIATYRWKDTIIPEKKVIEFKKDEKGLYKLETKILESEKIEKHNRKHFGFLGVELYQAIIESGLDTKECAFLSIDDPNQNSKIEINAITGEKTEIEKKPFEVKIENNRPKGKITIKPTEMLPILFKSIYELSEKIDFLQNKINEMEGKK